MQDYQDNLMKMISNTDKKRVIIIGSPTGRSMGKDIAAALAKSHRVMGVSVAEVSEAARQLEQAFREPLRGMDFGPLERRYMIPDEIGPLTEDESQDRRHQTAPKANHVVRRGKGQRKMKGGTRWE